MKTLRMFVGILVIVTAAAAARTEAATITNLNMTLYHQQTRYWCGPATVEMTVKYLTGRYYTQAYLARWMGTTYRGTSTSNSLRALRHFSNQAYGFSAFSRTRIIHNINYKRPVPVSFVCRYVSYSRYSSARHISPIKGYTGGGFYINDSAWGRKWASTTELHNATRYFGGGALMVRY